MTGNYGCDSGNDYLVLIYNYWFELFMLNQLDMMEWVNRIFYRNDTIRRIVLKVKQNNKMFIILFVYIFIDW